MLRLFIFSWLALTSPLCLGTEPEVPPKTECADQLAKKGVSKKWKWLAAGLFSAAAYGGTEYALTDPIQKSYTCPHCEPSTPMHIAVIGDSLSTDFHYSSDLPTLFRLRTTRSGGWFVDRSWGFPISFAEDAARVSSVTADSHARAGASVLGSPDASFGKRLGQISHLKEQVTETLTAPLPEHLMLWIGHNDADFAYTCSKNPKLDPDTYCKELPTQMSETLEVQLRRIAEKAVSEKHRMAITIFGIMEFEHAIEIRETVLKMHKSNRQIYPYLPQGIDGFPTLMPEYKEQGQRLSLAINEQYREVALRLDEEFRSQGVGFFYSDALAKLNYQRSDLSTLDGLHFSEAGHGRVATAAYDSTVKEREFINRPTYLAPVETPSPDESSFP